jgi:hypothetical protein
MSQVWIGHSDLTSVLRSINGWYVGCYNDREARRAVQYAIDRGYVAYRTHFSQMDPDGVRAYEITDAGLTWLRTHDADAEGAEKMRAWYRENASK